MKKILLIEDEALLSETITEMLIEVDYQVEIVSHGKAALEILKDKKFDIILSDINMPEMNGIDFAKRVKAEYNIPTLLMTGFSKDLNKEILSELGAVDFLTKPFRSIELLEALEVALVNKVIETDHKNFPYERIPIDYFILKPELEFDLFIRINNEKIIKIGLKGQSIPVHRIELYKSQKVKFLYVKQSDYGKVIQFNSDFTKVAAKSNQVDIQKKIKVIENTNKIIVEKVRNSGCFNEDDIYYSQEVLNSILKSVENETQTIDLISTLSDTQDWITAHSLGVSIVSMMLARQIGYLTEKEIKDLGFAGLYHDIGLNELPIETLKKKYEDYTPSEKELLERHPLISRDYLSCLKSINQDILDIVYYHNNDDFVLNLSPQIRKLKKYLEILNAADYFCYHTIANPMFTIQSPQFIADDLVNGKESKKYSYDIKNVFFKVLRRVS